MKNYHITHVEGKWVFSEEKAEQSIKDFITKDRAVDFAINYLKNKIGSLKIHNINGTIQEERTYPKSNDPRRSEG